MIEVIWRGIAALLLLWFLVQFLLIVHEYGHLLAFQRYGIKTDRITLGSCRLFTINMGGIPHEFGLIPLYALTVSNDYAKAPKQQRAVIAIAGPLASIVFGVLITIWDAFSPGWFSKIAAQASIALGIWNLVPFPPMDGWPVVEYFLEKMGIEVTDTQRKFLLAVGILSIGLIIWFSWDIVHKK